MIEGVGKRAGPASGWSPTTVLALAAGALVVALYCTHAWTLVRYPWDWSPDDGLLLDQARRVLDAPSTLYPSTVVPFPAVYGPLVPLLLAPLSRLPAPLATARLLALGWALLGAAALGSMLHRRFGLAWAAAGAALYLAPFDLSFWLLLVRVDGPLVALWLCAAAVLLPSELRRGASTLSPRRCAWGVALLLAAVLVKPTAILHGAPLVLAWLVVDRRSMLRLTVALGLAGVAAFALLQFVTRGGFLAVSRLWVVHPFSQGLTGPILVQYIMLTWPVTLLACGAAVLAGSLGVRLRREPSLALVAGGLAAVLLLAKQGAWWNYLIPLYAGTVAAACALLALASRVLSERSSAPRLARAAPMLLVSLMAIALAGSRPFPLPDARAREGARSFYGLVEQVRQRVDGPLLVSRPDLVYVLAGQAVEIEASSFGHLLAAGAPGTGEVLERLRGGRYALLVETWPWGFPERSDWHAALLANYEILARCELSWYFGRGPVLVRVRRGTRLDGLAAGPGCVIEGGR